MNATLERMIAHRSIRRFRPDPIPDDDIRRAVEAGQAASTSSAVQAYAVIQVTDSAERAALVPLTGGQEKVADCGAFFVICGDVRRHRRAVERAGNTYRSGLEAFLLAVIDASLFAQNFALAFESMGYGICYIGGLRNDLPAVHRLLELPEGVYPLYGLCVGRPDEAPGPRPRLPVDAVLFRDRYPDDAMLDRHLDAYDDNYRTYLEARGARTIRGWTEIMGTKFATVEREGIGAYYRGHGASMD